MSAAMLLPFSNKDAAAEISINSFNYSRKKAKVNNAHDEPCKFGSPCTENLTIALLNRTPSFENNVTSLCCEFPLVNRGLVGSLLESTSNDPIKAAYLIQQVSESSSSTHLDKRHAKRRERDWNYYMLDDSLNCCSNEENITYLNNSIEKHNIFSVKRQQLNHHNEINKSSNNMKTHEEEEEVEDEEVHVKIKVDSNKNTLPSSLNNKNDNDINNTNDDASSQKLQNKSNTGDSLRLLSRVVLSQFEKINQLQLSESQLINENKRLNDELTSTHEELRKCRESCVAFQYYLSAANRVSNGIFDDENQDGSSHSLNHHVY